MRNLLLVIFTIMLINGCASKSKSTNDIPPTFNSPSSTTLSTNEKLWATLLSSSLNCFESAVDKEFNALETRESSTKKVKKMNIAAKEQAQEAQVSMTHLLEWKKRQINNIKSMTYFHGNLKPNHASKAVLEKSSDINTDKLIGVNYCLYTLHYPIENLTQGDELLHRISDILKETINPSKTEGKKWNVIQDEKVRDIRKWSYLRQLERVNYLKEKAKKEGVKADLTYDLEILARELKEYQQEEIAYHSFSSYWQDKNSPKALSGLSKGRTIPTKIRIEIRNHLIPTFGFDYKKELIVTIKTSTPVKL